LQPLRLLKIESAKSLIFQRHKNTMSVALCRIALHAHHGDRVT